MDVSESQERMSEGKQGDRCGVNTPPLCQRLPAAGSPAASSSLGLQFHPVGSFRFASQTSQWTSKKMSLDLNRVFRYWEKDFRRDDLVEPANVSPRQTGLVRRI